MLQSFPNAFFLQLNNIESLIHVVLTFSLYITPAAPALRTPLSYAAPFAMMGHHPEINGSLTSPGVYGLHISPQMSAAAAAAYGRSPMVRFHPFLLPPRGLCRIVGIICGLNAAFAFELLVYVLCLAAGEIALLTGSLEVGVK